MKSVFENKLCILLKSRTSVLDTNTALSFLESSSSYEVINLRELSLQLAMLLVLLLRQRVQTFYAFDINYNFMDLADNRCTFCISKRLKYLRN